jgi:hypothetical protein
MVSADSDLSLFVVQRPGDSVSNTPSLCPQKSRGLIFSLASHLSADLDPGYTSVLLEVSFYQSRSSEGRLSLTSPWYAARANSGPRNRSCHTGTLPTRVNELLFLPTQLYWGNHSIVIIDELVPCPQSTIPSSLPQRVRAHSPSPPLPTVSSPHVVPNPA